MFRFLSMAALAVSLHMGASAHADEFAWESLIDQAAQSFEDPYRSLTYTQIYELRTVAVESTRLRDDSLSASARLESEVLLANARTTLSDAGIDADWLISQRWIVAERRETAATAINPELDGAKIALRGYAIPAPPDSDGTSIVYLVPERGMCSHMPPPNPNQMIRARIGGDWRPSMMHEPVRFTGILQAQETEHTFSIVDGLVAMRASFVMEVTHVETVAEHMSEAKLSNGRAQGIAGHNWQKRKQMTRKDSVSE